jgi:hypothetical protein
MMLHLVRRAAHTLCGEGALRSWPTAAAAAAYARDGFVLTPSPVLSEATIAALKDRYVSMFAGEFETGQYPDEWHWREGISRAQATREICNGWKADRLVASVVTSNALGELVSRLAGWEDARVGQDDVLWKPPGGDAVGYHTDGCVRCSASLRDLMQAACC